MKKEKTHKTLKNYTALYFNDSKHYNKQSQIKHF